MTKEELLELGLTEEQIAEVFKINGKDIEKAKGDLEAKEVELKTVKGQLKQANTQIESFKEMDIDTIKAKADEYKTKYEKAEKEAKEQLEKLQFEHKLESALSGAKAKNIKAVKALIDTEGLKLNNDEIVGLKEQLENIKKENDYLFDLEEPKETPPTFTRPTNKNVADEPESLGERLARKATENN